MNREEIDNKYKWDLTKLVASDEDFLVQIKDIEEDAKEFDNYVGNLSNIDSLTKCMLLYKDTNQKLQTLYVYANMKSHEDMSKSKYQDFVGKISNLITYVGTKTTFIWTEILKLDDNYIDEALKTDELAIFEHEFRKVLRQRDHILSKECEDILTLSTNFSNSFEDIHSILDNVDNEFYTIVVNGEEIKITHANYAKLIKNEDVNIRKEVYEKYYKFYMKHKNTLSTLFDANIKKDEFYAKVRHYESSLDLSLDSENIDTKVYRNLIDTVSKYLPSMHKYVDKYKEKLNLNEIHFYDLYVPLMKDMDKTVDFESAKKTVYDSLAVYDDAYREVVTHAFNDNWIDVYESNNKKSGGYCWGSSSATPYIFLNYNDTINDMFTLAHELGHAMHSYYTNNTQSSIYTNYSIFVAEIASTVNELLLTNYLLDNSSSEEETKYLNNNLINQYKTTVFRQTMFAEFELIVHEKSRNGDTLSEEILCGIYGELCKKYYGPNIVVDDNIKMEWSRIPHFYSSYYVYQYATGFLSSCLIVDKLLNEEGFVDKYKEFLKAGSSDYPLNILKKLGIDMTENDTLLSSLDKFSDLVDNM